MLLRLLCTLYRLCTGRSKWRVKAVCLCVGAFTWSRYVFPKVKYDLGVFWEVGFTYLFHDLKRCELHQHYEHPLPNAKYVSQNYKWLFLRAKRGMIHISSTEQAKHPRQLRVNSCISLFCWNNSILWEDTFFYTKFVGQNFLWANLHWIPAEWSQRNSQILYTALGLSVHSIVKGRSKYSLPCLEEKGKFHWSTCWYSFYFTKNWTNFSADTQQTICVLEYKHGV